MRGAGEEGIPGNEGRGEEKVNGNEREILQQGNGQLMPAAPEKECIEFDSGWKSVYILPIVYVLSVYMLPLNFVYGEKLPEAVGVCLYLLPVALGIGNIIIACTMYRPANRIILLQSSVIIKYMLIPFFILGGILMTMTLFMAVIPVPGFIFLGGFLAVGGWLIGMLILAFSSPYAIAYLRLSVRVGKHSNNWSIFHAVCQFLFIADVIDVMVLAFREERCKKITVAVIALLACLLGIAVIALLILLAVSILNLVGIV